MEAGADAPLRPSDSTDGSDSLALVERLKAGDERAWEQLYLLHHDALLFSIRSRLGPALREHLQSEEIFHSVVADALSDIQRFEPRGPQALRRWLSTCVVNKLRSKARQFGAARRAGARALTDSLAEGLAAKPEDAPRYVDAPRWEALERALGDLEDEPREIVLMRAFDGLSNAEVAERFGRTAAATSKIYNRALARLGARASALKALST